MARAECVVFRFIAPQESADAAILLDRRQKISSAGQNLVRVSLMAHIPHQPVVRRIERVMQSDREFHGAERRAGVATDT